MKITALVLLASFGAYAQNANDAQLDPNAARSWYVAKGQSITVPEDGVLLNDAAANNVDKAIKDLKVDKDKLAGDYNDLADKYNSSFTPLTCVLIAAGAFIIGAGAGVGLALAAQKH